MPSRLLGELRNFMSLDVSIRFDDPTTINLNDPTIPLSDEAIESLDRVERIARVVFGRNRQPTAQQGKVMENNGFPVSAGIIDTTGWRTGVIQTPKGKISY